MKLWFALSVCVVSSFVDASPLACDTICIPGTYCIKWDCLKCPSKTFQDKEDHKRTSCTPWSQPPGQHNWVVTKKGSSTNDVEYDCVKGTVRGYLTPLGTKLTCFNTTTVSMTTVLPTTKTTTVSMTTVLPTTNSVGRVNKMSTTKKNNDVGMDVGSIFGIFSLVVIFIIAIVCYCRYKKFCCCNPLLKKYYSEKDRKLRHSSPVDNSLKEGELMSGAGSGNRERTGVKTATGIENGDVETATANKCLLKKDYHELARILWDILRKSELNIFLTSCGFKKQNDEISSPEDFLKRIDKWNVDHSDKDILNLFDEADKDAYGHVFDNPDYINIVRKLKDLPPADNSLKEGELSSDSTINQLFSFIYKNILKPKDFFLCLDKKDEFPPVFIRIDNYQYFGHYEFVELGYDWVCFHKGWNHVKKIREALNETGNKDVLDSEKFKELTETTEDGKNSLPSVENNKVINTGVSGTRSDCADDVDKTVETSL